MRQHSPPEGRLSIIPASTISAHHKALFERQPRRLECSAVIAYFGRCRLPGNSSGADASVDDGRLGDVKSWLRRAGRAGNSRRRPL